MIRIQAFIVLAVLLSTALSAIQEQVPMHGTFVTHRVYKRTRYMWLHEEKPTYVRIEDKHLIYDV